MWDAATAEIAQRVLGSTELVRAITLEEMSLATLRPEFQDRDGSNPVIIARAIARHLALNVSDADIVEIVNNLATVGVTFERSDGAARWDGLGVHERRVVDGALGLFVTYLATGNLPPTIWEGELFFLGDRPSERAPGIIETGHDFLLEVVADRQVASCAIRPHAEGAFEVNLAFALKAATDHPIAIRLSTQRAAFDGTVAVIGAVLTTDGAALAEIGSAFLAAVADPEV